LISIALLGITVGRRAKPTVIAEKVSASRVKALEYTFLAIAVCAWVIAVSLMIDGHFFGDRTTGIAIISFIIGVGCLSTFSNVRIARIRRFQMEA
jgi:hypothetical protein